jgi:hypothetical protein
MGLRGRLSNPPESLSGLLSHFPTRESDHKARVTEPKKQVGRPDGRRKFGSVSGAILAVLAQTDSEMKVKAIQEHVEHILGGKVSYYSVADYLLVRSRGKSPSSSELDVGTTGSCETREPRRFEARPIISPGMTVTERQMARSSGELFRQQ